MPQFSVSFLTECIQNTSVKKNVDIIHYATVEEGSSFYLKSIQRCCKLIQIALSAQI